MTPALVRLQRWLIDPLKPMADPDPLRRARLLALVLLCLVPFVIYTLASAVYIPDDLPPLWRILDFLMQSFTLAGILLSYGLTRLGQVRAAISTLIGISTLTVFWLALPNEPIMLYYAVVPVLLSMIFVGPRLALPLTIAVAVLMLIWGITLPSELQQNIPLISFLAISLVSILAIHERDQSVRARQSQLLESEARYRSIVTSTHDGIWLVDAQRRTLYVNSALAQMLDYPADLMIGTPVEVYLASDQRAQADTWFVGQPQTAPQRFTLQRRGGTQFPALGVINPLLDDAQRRIGTLAVIHNITAYEEAEARRTELALERTRVEMFRTFFNGLSHDLRTPLTIMRSSVYLIERAPTEERRKDHLHILDEQVDRLERLVEGLLKMARLEDPVRTIQRVPLDINRIVQGVLDMQQPKFAQKHQQAHFTPGQVLPVSGNVSELTDLFQQVILNAHQFTPEGGEITICSESDEQSVRVIVQDNGIGMSPDELAMVFRPFYRGDSARGTTTGGAGLGLTLAQTIAQDHGGRIDARSTLHSGSTFTIHFPAVQSASPGTMLE